MVTALDEGNREIGQDEACDDHEDTGDGSQCPAMHGLEFNTPNLNGQEHLLQDGRAR